MYWVKLLGEIAFEGAAVPDTIARVYTLEHVVEALADKVESYDYNGAACRALPLAALLGVWHVETDFVFIESTDGLTKTEKYDIFAGQLLVFEGTPDAPLYTGPELPAGMRVKNVDSFQVGGILVKM